MDLVIGDVSTRNFDVNATDLELGLLAVRHAVLSLCNVL